MQSETYLSDYFILLFSETLDIEHKLIRQQSISLDCFQFSEHIQKCIKEAEQNALHHAKTQPDFKQALFAFVAWFDEIMAKFPDWSSGFTPLQVIYFSTNNAGNEFFDYLKRLENSQDEVREVYYMALCLGFTGEHYLQAGPAGELQALKTLHARQLAHELFHIPSLKHTPLHPQAYSVADPPPLPLPFNFWPYLIYGVLLTALIAGIAYYWLNRKPSHAWILEQASKRLQLVECADLQAELNEAYKLKIGGYLPKPELAQSLHTDLSQIPGVAEVQIETTLHPWPFCRMKSLLKQYTTTATGLSGEPRIRPLGQKITFEEGDQLQLSVTTPNQPSYVYVDYLQKDGIVIHMLPMQRLPEHFFGNSQNFTLGSHNKDEFLFVVRPPFGLDMMIIYTSPTPLFPTLRSEFESFDTYIAALETAFQNLHAQGLGKQLQSDYYFISTTE